MNDDGLRYLRQVVMKAMNWSRSRMRGSDRLLLNQTIDASFATKDASNPTKQIDKQAEDLVLTALLKKLPKVGNIDSLSVFSEEQGILTHPKGMQPEDADWIIFIDPVDGTEFAESLQGGWCLLALYDRVNNRMDAAVAGDMFLNRLYWASRDSPAEGLDFVTHSWFKLDGGPNPKRSLARARINVLTTKVERYQAVAQQTRLLDAVAKADGRVNLSWGSNMVIQVAAGYADAAVEFCKGFASYDILPGLFIAERSGLTILGADGKKLTTEVNIAEIFQSWRTNPKKPKRTKFVVAKEETLAYQLYELIDWEK